MESIVPENPSLKGLKPGTKLTNKINNLQTLIHVWTCGDFHPFGYFSSSIKKKKKKSMSERDIQVAPY